MCFGMLFLNFVVGLISNRSTVPIDRLLPPTNRSDVCKKAEYVILSFDHLVSGPPYLLFSVAIVEAR